ncbi:uncharacterized protein ACMZJ9_002545 [Mantella aurantiaca]
MRIEMTLLRQIFDANLFYYCQLERELKINSRPSSTRTDRSHVCRLQWPIFVMPPAALEPAWRHNCKEQLSFRLANLTATFPETMVKKNMRWLLSIVCLTFCLHLSQAQNARTCNDCNSTANINCDSSQGGVVVCSCKPGFIGDGLNCTRIAFCDTIKCCPEGYTWDSKTKECADVNECIVSTLNKCSPTDNCVNKNGIFLCSMNRNAACGRAGKCSQDLDCLNINGDQQCADPCSNYNIANGTNRLYSLSSPGRFASDRNYFGWYRYVGKGVSLREGCVATLKCGSMQPYSLGGAHPNIEDGIVALPLLSNTMSLGCVPGANILVKACPAGHYVYKFSGSLRFDTYCTDTLIPNPPSATTTTATTTTTSTTTPTTTTTTPTTTTTTTTPTTTTTTTTPTTTTTTPTTTTTTPTTTTTTTTTPTTTTTTPTTTTTTPTTTTTTPTTTTTTPTTTTTTTTTPTTTTTTPTTTTTTPTTTTTTPTTTTTTPTTTTTTPTTTTTTPTTTTTTTPTTTTTTPTTTTTTPTTTTTTPTTTTTTPTTTTTTPTTTTTTPTTTTTTPTTTTTTPTTTTTTPTTTTTTPTTTTTTPTTTTTTPTTTTTTPTTTTTTPTTTTTTTTPTTTTTTTKTTKRSTSPVEGSGTETWFPPSSKVIFSTVPRLLSTTSTTATTTPEASHCSGNLSVPACDLLQVLEKLKALAESMVDTISESDLDTINNKADQLTQQISELNSAAISTALHNFSSELVPAAENFLSSNFQ